MYYTENNMMQDDYFYYKAHQDDIVKNHLGDLVILKDAHVLGYYKDEQEALIDMRRNNHAPGTFMLRQCKPRGMDTMFYRNNRVHFGTAETSD
ncbi:hypothetical protein AGMMS50267_16800 [Spirochaetia bacterium]|nr:hypothetical protein AGMMS50267_16800 [Spirochaetia bacterium]